jgi:hypothetical protein
VLVPVDLCEPLSAVVGAGVQALTTFFGEVLQQQQKQQQQQDKGCVQRTGMFCSLGL